MSEVQLPQDQIPKHYPMFAPNDETGKYLNLVMENYQKDFELKLKEQPILSMRTLKTFWDQSNKDYLQYLVDSSGNNDWMREYPSGITRDKVNAFISKLVKRMISAQITAQNKNQTIDRILSRITKILVDFAVRNDGRPFDSGHSKFVRGVHKGMVEGTLHKLIFINEEGEHETVIIPNEEVFIPNFFQFDIQKQGHFLWVQDNITYEEAKAEFGEFENFKYVQPGAMFHYNPSGSFAKEDGGHSSSIIPEKKCQVIRAWYPVPKDKLGGKKRAKYFNIIVNGIPMLEYDNIDVYKHGYYPIPKTVFEILDSHYYWGNSLPNKIRHDKKWITALKTIMGNVGKLNMLPPMLAEDGLNIDQEVYVPAKITSITGKASQLKEVPGLHPISQGDVALLAMAERSADEGSVSPVGQGQSARGQRTLGELQLQEANADELLSNFGLMVSFGVEQETWLLINNLYQFYPRKKINELVKFSVPNQKLASGKTGTMEVIFEDVLKLTEQERAQKERASVLEVMRAGKKGIHKEINYIDPSYAKNAEWFIEVTGNPVNRKSEEMERYLAVATYREVHLNNPNISQEEATRIIVRATTPDEEDNLVISQEVPEMSMAGIGGGQGGMPGTEAPMTRMPNSLKGAMMPA